jgi:hypothetical protein
LVEGVNVVPPSCIYTLQTQKREDGAIVSMRFRAVVPEAGFVDDTLEGGRSLHVPGGLKAGLLSFFC